MKQLEPGETHIQLIESMEAKAEKMRAALRLARECVVESFDHATTTDDTMLAEGRLRDIDDALGNKP